MTRRTGPVDPRLLTYARASRGFLAVTAAIVLAQTGVVVAFALVLTTTLVRAVAGAPADDLWPLLGAGAGLVVLRSLLAVASEHVSARGGAAAALQLRDALVSAVRRLGPGWLSSRNAAALSVTAGHGLESLDAYFARYLPQLVATGIVTPILLGAMFLADPLSGLIVLLTIPLIPVFMVLIGLATRAAQRRQYDTLGSLAARFADTVAGLGTLKAFGREHRAADAIGGVTRRYARETMAVLRVSFLSGFALEFLASISVAILAVTIGFRLLAGEMDLLVGLFVLLLAPEAYLPLRQVGAQFHAAAEGVAATADIFDVLDAAASFGTASVGASERSGTTAARGGGRARRLEARRLRVQRGDRLLPPVDLTIERGRITWLRGPSGAGKSSIVAALMGFAEFDGEVLVDGVAVPHARGAVAWAGQRPGLVSGSVAANVALGDNAPDLARVRACLAEAQAPDIDPARELGVGGSGLSGGQAQRVAIARALYRLGTGRAGVLVLDEPSSALDADTEAALWHRIRHLADTGTGVLLVSHRESAASIADTTTHLRESAASPREMAADSRKRNGVRT
ncbi:thiol reductant ABC exporter subunit CydD [Microbacterium sp. RD1]|uniref:thiol reductant ABC exporter subunit CydD n=1 Tax=Microbacterium sp. RD1 TaxID=3457313 RepID=UPI003FA613BF